MAFTDLDLQKIKKTVGVFCEQRTPAHLKDKLRYEYEIEKQNVMVYEVRPAFRQEGKFIRMPMAKLTYVSSRKIWKLFWKRASGKWEKYEPEEEAMELNTLIQEIDQDPYGCFFG